MADFSELLGQVMSNPQMMNQLASMAQSLGLQGNSPPPASTTPQNMSMPESSPDPRVLMQSLMQMSKNMGGNERQLALIQALKPFVSPERARKLDRAIQIAQMSRLAEQALGTFSSGMNQAGDFHV